MFLVKMSDHGTIEIMIKCPAVIRVVVSIRWMQLQGPTGQPGSVGIFKIGGGGAQGSERRGQMIGLEIYGVI